VGVVYLNSLEIGWASTWVGFIVLGLYIPIWFYTQHQTRRSNRKAPASDSSSHDPQEDDQRRPVDVIT
jgi:hypothetical protein